MSLVLPEALRQEIAREKGPALLITRSNVRLAEALEEMAPELSWSVLTKQDLRGWGGRALVRLLRARHHAALIIEDEEREARRRRDLYGGMLLVGRARSRWILTTGVDGITARRINPLPEWPRLLGSFRPVVSRDSAHSFATGGRM